MSPVRFSRMKLSIVIPAYNEEQRLPAMMDVYVPYFTAAYGSDVELIVAVNGSRDRTEELARAYADRYEQVVALIEHRPIGKGGAIMMGFDQARGELVGFVDGDGATAPEAFQDLVEHIGDADMIIASRWMEGSVVDPPQPWTRRVASRIFNFLVRLLFGLRITDTQCGAKLCRRPGMEAVRPLLGLTRWAFDVDLLFQFRRTGLQIVERPTVWRDIGGSQLNVPRASSQMFVAICRLRLLHSPFRWVVSLYDVTLGKLLNDPGAA